MKMAIDAMGGDYAPEEIIKGAVTGARQNGVGVILVGPQDRIEQELAKYNHNSIDVSIVHTDEYLIEGEPAAYALRKKRNASILVAVKQVRDGKADAVLSMGPTGGVYSAALQVLGMVEGISRPMIGGPFLGYSPQSIIVDMGGNVDNRPDQLLDFAVVGTVYARKSLNILNPTVALLSNGKEEGKGNDVVKQAYDLFKKSGLNFVGNVEGSDLVAGSANVIVCDGFVGNCVVKFNEGLALKNMEWWRSKLAETMPLNKVDEIIEDYRQALYPPRSAGAGTLWGVNGVVCKNHGASRSQDIVATIEIAKRAVEMDLVNALKAELEVVRRRLNQTSLVNFTR
jgi:glycerol-3-phosphate acyltransferase PlsX